MYNLGESETKAKSYVFGIPLFLLLAHQHLSNSAFGLNNSKWSLLLFLLFILSLVFFLLRSGGQDYVKVGSTVFLGLFIAAWVVLQGLFKDLANLYINFFLTFYILRLGGLNAIRNQLAFLVVISVIISFFQISGTSEVVHLLNSQYLQEVPGGYVKNVEIDNIMRSSYGNYFTFDSRYVRAPGIFHSSALVSGIFVMYIAFVFCGYIKSNWAWALIPFLSFFSGSKLVLAATILFLLVALVFRQVNIKRLLILTVSTLVAMGVHTSLFYSLLEFQFNFDLFLFSIEIRLEQYNWESFDFTVLIPYLSGFILLIAGLFLLNKAFNFFKNTQKLFCLIILSLALMGTLFATPHIANLLFGWFYFPAFFAYEYFNKSNEKALAKDDVLNHNSLDISI